MVFQAVVKRFKKEFLMTVCGILPLRIQVFGEHNKERNLTGLLQGLRIDVYGECLLGH